MDQGPDWPLAVFETFARLEDCWLAPPRPDPPGFHGYEPWPIRDFIDAVNIADEITATSGPRLFLDVGCGIGTKLALMASLGWQVAGIDWHQPYLDAAARIVPEAALTLADARQVGRFEANVVFAYRFADDDEVWADMERRLVEGSQEGAVLIIPETRSTVDLGLEALGPNVWRR